MAEREIIWHASVAATQFSTSTMNMNDEVVIVSIVFENGATESRKIIVK